MVKRKVIVSILLLLSLLFLGVCSQIAVGSIMWTKTYSSLGETIPMGLVESSDGNGYVFTGFTGTTSAYSHENQSAIIVKVDSSGNMQWNRTFTGSEYLPYSSILACYGLAIVKVEDNGYLVGGSVGSHYMSSNFYSAGPDGNCWLVKVDSSGNTQWNKTYGSGQARSIVQTTDRGFVVARQSGNGQMSLLKVDASGNEQWSKTYTVSQIMGEDANIKSVIRTTDGGYALIAWTGYSFENYYAWHLIKVDSSGNVMWNRTFSNNFMIRKFLQSYEGGYLLSGYTFDPSNSSTIPNASLTKLDSSGNLQWNKTYKIGAFLDIIPSGDGGYALSGGYYSDASATTINPCFVKMNSSGDVHWSRTYAGPDWAAGISAVRGNDGGYVILSLLGANIGLIKTDEEGTTELLLDVPYQGQGDYTNWCAPTSLAMVLRYYGKDFHSWDYTYDVKLPTQEGVKIDEFESYINTYYPDLSVEKGVYYDPVFKDAIFEDIKSDLADGYPVLLEVGLHLNEAVSWLPELAQLVSPFEETAFGYTFSLTKRFLAESALFVG